MENKLNLEELKKHSKHIDSIYARMKTGETVSLSEKMEIQKFYIYAQMLFTNIEYIGKNILLDIRDLSREETLFFLEFLFSNKVINNRIVDLLNSRDIESIRLGINLLKNIK